MGSKTSDLPTDVTLSNLPAIPVAPASPSFNTGALAMSGATAPTYTKPSFVAPTLGSIGSMNLPVKPTAPTLTSSNNAVDIFVFMTIDGGTTYYGFTAGQAFG